MSKRTWSKTESKPTPYNFAAPQSNAMDLDLNGFIFNIILIIFYKRPLGISRRFCTKNSKVLEFSISKFMYINNSKMTL